MPAAVVDGDSRRRQGRIRQCTDGNADRLLIALLGVEYRRATNRAEPEGEFCSLVPDAQVFGGGAEDREGSRKPGQRCKDTAGSLLAGEAVADADHGFALHLNAQLSAAAGSGACGAV